MNPNHALSWSLKTPQNVVDRELLAQADMRERGRRLTAAAERAKANTVDGETLTPLSESFKLSARGAE